MFATLGSLTVGYCNGIIGTTLGQDSFLDYFGINGTPNSTGDIGAINGLYSVGGLFGCLSVGWTADKFGRRLALLIASCFAIAGSALQAGSIHVAMFIVARFITALGTGTSNALLPSLPLSHQSHLGAILTVVPMWQSEVAPPKTRGFLVGMHGKIPNSPIPTSSSDTDLGVFILLGYTIAAWIGVGFSYVNSSAVQWRVPLALQAVFPLLLASGVLFLPESPRWRKNDACSITAGRA